MTRFLLLLAAALVTLPGCAQDDARTYLNQGVQAYRNADYAAATALFQKAVAIEPESKPAHLYLATAHMSQYISGSQAPENLQLADRALAEFRRVLEIDPTDEVATASIAQLYYDQKKLAEAREWNRKRIALNPASRDAYYTLGVIAWTEWLVPDREARNKLGMTPEDPGPLRVESVRWELKARYLPILDDGIANLERALELDKEYADAMAYMNLLVRYRADLVDTPEEYARQIEIADEWIQKAMAAKRREREPQR